MCHERVVFAKFAARIDAAALQLFDGFEGDRSAEPGRVKVSGAGGDDDRRAPAGDEFFDKRSS